MINISDENLKAFHCEMALLPRDVIPTILCGFLQNIILNKDVIHHDRLILAEINFDLSHF